MRDDVPEGVDGLRGALREARAEARDQRDRADRLEQVVRATADVGDGPEMVEVLAAAREIVETQAAFKLADDVTFDERSAAMRRAQSRGSRALPAAVSAIVRAAKSAPTGATAP